MAAIRKSGSGDVRVAEEEEIRPAARPSARPSAAARVRDHEELMSRRSSSARQDTETMQQLQLAREEKIAEIHASAHRTNQLAHEATLVGEQTLLELDKQDKQLDRVEQSLDSSTGMMAIAKYHISSMKSIWFSWFGTKPHERPKSPRSSPKASPKPSPQVSRKTLQQQVYQEEQAAAPSASGASASMDEELDSTLDSISSNLTQLKHIAVAMGSALDTSNEKLERIQTKSDDLEFSIQRQRKKTEQLLAS